jgi:hypothetical protein
MKLKTLAVFTVITLFAITFSPQANAWEPNSGSTDFGDKQFILETYFVSGKGAFANRRPSGPHKEFSFACTGGFFEAGFFDIASSGDLLTIGSVKAIKVKFDGKLSSGMIATNTDKGTNFIQVNNAKDLARKLKNAKTFAVEMSTGSGYYRANFDVKDFAKYSSKFSAAGCKF